jgi:hypothetical protein
VWFGKKKDRVPPEVRRNAGAASSSGFLRIEYDMMLKGNIVKRRTGQVRQYCVTVDGSTRLVTSGDVVDQKTYDALVAAGAIAPVRSETPAPGKD